MQGHRTRFDADDLEVVGVVCRLAELDLAGIALDDAEVEAGYVGVVVGRSLWPRQGRIRVTEEPDELLVAERAHAHPRSRRRARRRLGGDGEGSSAGGERAALVRLGAVALGLVVGVERRTMTGGRRRRGRWSRSRIVDVIITRRSQSRFDSSSSTGYSSVDSCWKPWEASGASSAATSAVAIARMRAALLRSRYLLGVLARGRRRAEARPRRAARPASRSRARGRRPPRSSRPGRLRERRTRARRVVRGFHAAQTIEIVSDRPRKHPSRPKGGPSCMNPRRAQRTSRVLGGAYQGGVTAPL